MADPLFVRVQASGKARAWFGVLWRQQPVEQRFAVVCCAASLVGLPPPPPPTQKKAPPARPGVATLR
eukprot:5039464-Alexandrium_andersonii.AAC.1